MPLTIDELRPLLRLGLVEGIGPNRLAELVARFGDADRAMAAREPELRAIPGIGPRLARRIREAGSEESRTRTERALRTLERLDAFAMTPEDPAFPRAFAELPEPPHLLFGAGDLELLRRPAVAVVGTRTPTAYGRQAAESLSADLARQGILVVSGMARGIDAAAHLGALDAGGATAGILGHGIDHIYPPEARRLFARVRRDGLLLTEYPPGEAPHAGNFPRRNRLITALSRVVVIVEMGHRSGAQHSVNYALEQGREVMAVPGPIGSATSAGTNQLIKDGALMVTSAADVLEEIFGVGSTGAPALPGHVPELRSAPRGDRTRSGLPLLPLLTEEEAGIVSALESAGQGTALHIDEIARRGSRGVAETLTLLLQLELRELVTAEPGMRFSRSLGADPSRRDIP